MIAAAGPVIEQCAPQSHAEFSDAYYDRVERWSSSIRYAREIADLLVRLDLHAGSDLLDVGCGTGSAIRCASRRGLRTVGIDRPTAWTRHCPIRPVIRADATRLPFRAASFDAVLLFHVLAHLDFPDVCLTEIHQVLRRGGRIALSTPNAEYLDALKRASTTSRYVPDPTVRRHFTAGEVHSLLVSAGFLVRHASTYDPIPDAAGAGLPGERLLFVAEHAS